MKNKCKQQSHTVTPKHEELTFTMMSKATNTNVNVNSTMNDQQQAQVDSLGMSSLTLDSFSYSKTLMKPIDVNESPSDDTASTCASSYMSSMSSSTNLSGWGSAASRKSYACLRTLEEQQSRRRPFGTTQQLQQLQPQPQQPKRMRRQIQDRSYVGESWGYFVDTPDC